MHLISICNYMHGLYITLLILPKERRTENAIGSICIDLLVENLLQHMQKYGLAFLNSDRDVLICACMYVCVEMFFSISRNMALHFSIRRVEHCVLESMMKVM